MLSETSPEEGNESEQAQDIETVRRSNFILSKIRDNDRAIDPFGMLMDPANPLPVAEVADENDEFEATTLLKKEFPRGSKVKIKPFGFKENLLQAKVFNIKGTKEMTEILVTKDLASEICPS